MAWDEVNFWVSQIECTVEEPRTFKSNPAPVQPSGLTTSAALPLPARPTVLLSGSSLGEFLGHLVFQTSDSDQKALLVDGLLQSLDVSFNLLLHALSEAAEIAAPWLWANKTYCVSVISTQRILTACVLKIKHILRLNCKKLSIIMYGWPVVSPGLTSASSSNVMRVTSLLEGLRARRPLAFLEESHLRLTNVTRQLLQGWPPPVGDTVSHCLWGNTV